MDGLTLDRQSYVAAYKGNSTRLGLKQLLILNALNAGDCTNDELKDAGWPHRDEGPAPNTFHVTMHFLRNRLEPIGLTIVTVRRKKRIIEV